MRVLETRSRLDAPLAAAGRARSRPQTREVLDTFQAIARRAATQRPGGSPDVRDLDGARAERRPGGAAAGARGGPGRRQAAPAASTWCRCSRRSPSCARAARPGAHAGEPAVSRGGSRARRPPAGDGRLLGQQQGRRLPGGDLGDVSRAAGAGDGRRGGGRGAGRVPRSRRRGRTRRRADGPRDPGATASRRRRRPSRSPSRAKSSSPATATCRSPSGTWSRWSMRCCCRRSVRPRPSAVPDEWVERHGAAGGRVARALRSAVKHDPQLHAVLPRGDAVPRAGDAEPGVAARERGQGAASCRGWTTCGRSRGCSRGHRRG